MNQLRAVFAVSAALCSASSWVRFLRRPLTPGCAARHPALWQGPAVHFSERPRAERRAGADTGTRYTSAIWGRAVLSVSVDPAGLPALGESRARNARLPDCAQSDLFRLVEAVLGLTLVQTEMRLVAKRRAAARSRKPCRHARGGPRHPSPPPGAEDRVIPLAAGRGGRAQRCRWPSPRACRGGTGGRDERAVLSLRYRYFTIDRRRYQGQGLRRQWNYCGNATAPYRGNEDVGARGGPERRNGYRFSPHVRGDLILGFAATCSMRRTLPVPPTKIQGSRDFVERDMRRLLRLVKPRDGLRTSGPALGLAVNESARSRSITDPDSTAVLRGRRMPAPPGRSWPGAGTPCRTRTALDIRLPVVSLGQARNRPPRRLWRRDPAS